MDDAEERSATEPADASGALSDPLRIDVLRALVTHHRETGAAAPIGFADLRRRVDVRDSGRFRYHLEQLRGTFVEPADESYHTPTELPRGVWHLWGQNRRSRRLLPRRRNRRPGRGRTRLARCDSDGACLRPEAPDRGHRRAVPPGGIARDPRVPPFGTASAIRDGEQYGRSRRNQ